MIVGGFELLVIATVLPDNRKEMLLNGEVDCLVACYSKTDTRLENFDFSPMYYTDVTPVMVENSSRITDINQLKDGTFGIMSGSNAGPLLAIKLFDMGIIGEEVISNTDESTEYDHATVIKYPSYEDLSIALEEGRVDAAVMDGVFVDTYINDDRSLREDFSVSDQASGTRKGANMSFMSKKLKVKSALLAGVVVLSLIIMGVILSTMQDNISLENYRADIQREMDELPTLLETADDETAQNEETFDAIYQSKAASVAFMANNKADYEATNAKMQEYKELLGVDNVMIVNKDGKIEA